MPPPAVDAERRVSDAYRDSGTTAMPGLSYGGNSSEDSLADAAWNGSCLSRPRDCAGARHELMLYVADKRRMRSARAASVSCRDRGNAKMAECRSSRFRRRVFCRLPRANGLGVNSDPRGSRFS